MTEPPLRIRAATGADAAQICRIYNQGIQDRVATLETESGLPRSAPRGSGRADRVTPSWSPRATTV